MAETEIKSINGKTLADVTAREKKLDKNQGVDNAGKILGIGEDGNVTPQDKPSYTLTDADKTAVADKVVADGVAATLADMPSGGGTTTVYSSPSEVVLRPNMQIIAYAGGSGTLTFTIGTATATFGATNDNCLWALWIPTSNTAGSLIRASGTRTYMQTGTNPATIGTMGVSYSASNSYVVITIG